LDAEAQVEAIPIDLITTVIRIERSECPICCEEFDRTGDFVELTCGHNFHRLCFYEWRKKGKSTMEFCDFLDEENRSSFAPMP
jgi:hypothetical protein